MREIWTEWKTEEKKMTKKENFTINIAQESCERASITDDQTVTLLHV